MASAVAKSSILGTLFPSGRYDEVSKKYKTLVLHYLIALAQPSENIVKWIQSRAEKKPQHLDHQSDVYRRLTPLAVCAIAGNVEVAKALLKAGANPRLADFKGWTPLHHATVLGHGELQDILLEALGGVDTAAGLRSLHGGNYTDLQALLSAKPVESENPVCLIEEASAVNECTAGRFHEITNAQFCNKVAIEPEQLMNWWVDTENVFDPSSLAYSTQQKLLEIMQPRALEELRKVQEIPAQLILCNEQVGGYGVKAGQPIGRYQGVTIYGGRLVCVQQEAEAATTLSATDYVQHNVDATDIRNMGPMINDAFPNCGVVTVRADGFEYQLILASEEIPAGSFLYINYTASHNVKTKYIHHELNLAGLLKFLEEQAGRVRAWLDDSLKSPQDLQAVVVDIAGQSKLDKIKYLMETPSTLLHLIGISKFPLELILAVYNKKELLGLDKDSCAIVFLCGCIENNLSENAEALGKVAGEIRQLCSAWAKDYPVITIVNLLQMLASIKSEGDWVEFIKDLPHFLAASQALVNYEFEDNEQYIERIRENLPGLHQNKQKVFRGQIEAFIQNYNEADPRVAKLKSLMSDP